MSDRDASGRYALGHVAGNAAPIGAEKWKRGRKVRKVRHTGRDSDWIFVHRLNWEAVNGPIPPGHVLAFRDGDMRNASVDNLELITASENMARNSVHHLPRPLRDLCFTHGLITREINKRTRHGRQ
jgi:hypothetical protein